MGFATHDVAEFRPGSEGVPPRVSVALLGLLGPEGPLPLHLTRRVLDRLAQRWFTAGVDGATSDTTFLDFANLLQHRAMALYYRAWADQNPAVQAERDDAGPGSGDAGGAGRGRCRRDRAGQARAGRGARPPGARRRNGSPASLGAAIGLPVRVVEFVGAWAAIPSPPADPARGAPTPGSAATPWSGREASRARAGSSSGSARSGSPTTARCCRAASGSPALRHAILHGLGETLDVDVRPVLRVDEIPAARLGAAALGHIGVARSRCATATRTTCASPRSSASRPTGREQPHEPRPR